MILSTTFRADAGDITTDPNEHAVTRTYARQGTTRQDTFTHNDRSELTAATLGTNAYGYAYDKDADGGKASWTNAQHLPEGREAERRLRVNIGNREMPQEAAQAVTTYATNPLNQYLSISHCDFFHKTPFLPEYDAAGNQTKIRTSTGIWTAVYDDNNRPVSFTSEDGQTLVECGYDYMGRRFMKKVTVGDVVQSHHFYLYRGYLQIAALDMKTAGAPALWYTHWDPTEPRATRPLCIRKNGTWYTYTHDLTKNITELYNTDGTIATTYDYAPYGDVTATGTDQPFQWSSEVYDAELGMVYYNYRHYNPMEGRWIGRDPIAEDGDFNLYCFVENTFMIDWLGLDLIPSKEECQRRIEKEAQRQLDKGLGKACTNANGSNNPEACKQATKAIMDALKDCAGVPKEEQKLPPGAQKKKEEDEEKTAKIKVEAKVTIGKENDPAFRGKVSAEVNDKGDITKKATGNPVRHGGTKAEVGIEGSMPKGGGDIYVSGHGVFQPRQNPSVDVRVGYRREF